VGGHCYENGNETLGSMKGGKCLDEMSTVFSGRALLHGVSHFNVGFPSPEKH
jgi:hypothetical protein